MCVWWTVLADARVLRGNLSEEVWDLCLKEEMCPYRRKLPAVLPIALCALWPSYEDMPFFFSTPALLTY